MKNTKKYAYALLVTIISAAIVVGLTQGYVGNSELMTAGLALIGTFSGALFAFRLNENKEMVTERRRRVIALNGALFMIARQRNAIANYIHRIPKGMNHAQLAFEFNAEQPPEYRSLQLDFDALSFMIESGNPTLLLDLSVVQDGFQQAFYAVSIRNEFYVKEVQPAFSQHGLAERPVSLAEIKEKVGSRIFEGAMSGVAVSMEHIHATEKSLAIASERLLAFCRQEYKGERFTEYRANA